MAMSDEQTLRDKFATTGAELSALAKAARLAEQSGDSPTACTLRILVGRLEGSSRQWRLSGNAEFVDWSDLAESGRAYADNLIGETAISELIHIMADELDRLRLAATLSPQERTAVSHAAAEYQARGASRLNGADTAIAVALRQLAERTQA